MDPVVVGVHRCLSQGEEVRDPKPVSGHECGGYDRGWTSSVTGVTGVVGLPKSDASVPCH